MEIIKIGAVWCPACLVMYKIWDKVREEYPNIKITSYDLDMDSLEIEKYNVGATLPVIIITKEGKELKRLIGEKKFEDIKKAIIEVGN
ncbi:MAG: thioredoxin family protein [Bacilli bacterium]